MLPSFVLCYVFFGHRIPSPDTQSGRMRRGAGMLEDYFAIVGGDLLPRYLRAKTIPAPASSGCPSASLLDEKAARAKRIMSRCRFCERRCAIDRLAGKTGYCGVGATSRVASEFLHMGEEPELVPSLTIFLAGCTLRCVYCQNWDIAMSAGLGSPVDPGGLARIIESGHERGAKNVNLVGGDPDPHIWTVLEALRLVDAPLPVVWNSNMYLSRESMEILDGVVDVYLGDFRYGNDACAARYSDAPRYLETVTRNFEEAFQQADVMLRHLVLPGHLACCTEPIMAWCAEHIPGAYFNLMFQYRPEYRASWYPEIDRRLSPDERREALDLAARYRIAVRD